MHVYVLLKCPSTPKGAFDRTNSWLSFNENHLKNSESSLSLLML